MEIKHKPVLLNEVLSFIDFSKFKIFVDLTIGEGGHSEEILKRASDDSLLVGFDLDKEILVVCQNRLKKLNKKFILFNENYKNFYKKLKEIDINRVDFIILDLGFSSFQLENGRGFSFLDEKSLHMGYSLQTKGADYYINKLSKNELIYIFDEFGEIKESERIADEIIKYRKMKLIETSIDLSKIVEKVIKRRGKIHPATKVFQALRIFVNKEFENLREFLLVFSDYLNKDGVLAVISYHSIEDRIVKNSLKELKDMGKIIFLNKKVITPSESEIKENRRSRSAKLRVVQKV